MKSEFGIKKWMDFDENAPSEFGEIDFAFVSAFQKLTGRLISLLDRFETNVATSGYCLKFFIDLMIDSLKVS